jgi:hypothetical protein
MLPNDHGAQPANPRAYFGRRPQISSPLACESQQSPTRALTDGAPPSINTACRTPKTPL